MSDFFKRYIEKRSVHFINEGNIVYFDPVKSVYFLSNSLTASEDKELSSKLNYPVIVETFDNYDDLTHLLWLNPNEETPIFICVHFDGAEESLMIYYYLLTEEGALIFPKDEDLSPFEDLIQLKKRFLNEVIDIRDDRLLYITGSKTLDYDYDEWKR
jgi:hypothetical protein